MCILAKNVYNLGKVQYIEIAKLWIEIKALSQSLTQVFSTILKLKLLNMFLFELPNVFV